MFDIFQAIHLGHKNLRNFRMAHIVFMYDHCTQTKTTVYVVMKITAMTTFNENKCRELLICHF